MRILFDENMESEAEEISRLNTHHPNRTRMRLVWKKNGELLSLALREFDVFITMDQSISIILLQASSNRRVDVEPLMTQVNGLLHTIGSGTLFHISQDPTQ